MARTYVTIVWFVAWSIMVCNSGKVTKCCPRDMILRVDLATCTGYDSELQGTRELYEWSSDSEPDNTPESHEELSLSIFNNTAPWWIPASMEFLKADNLSHNVIPDSKLFESEGRFPCDVEDRKVMVLDNDVVLLDNGQLAVFWSDNNKLIFETSEYCIDRVSLVENFTLSMTGSDKMKKHARRSVPNAEPKQTEPKFSYVALACQTCSKILCIPKCCNKGLVLEYKKNAPTGCRKTNLTASISLKNINGSVLQSSDFFFSPMRPPYCGTRGSYLSNLPNGAKHTDYQVLPDGRLQVEDGQAIIEKDDYCIDLVIVDGKPFTESVLACRVPGANSPAGTLKFRDILYGTYFVVGAIFLAATLLIYAVLPELRVTIHSGNLIAHTICLFVSYSTLAATTLATNLFNEYFCVTAAFVIQFSFLAAFFWLNVMCADIAWTFSGLRLLTYSNKIENEKKKFIIYSSYAWGSSIIISALTAIAEFTNLLVSSPQFKPNFGQRDCWFSNKMSVGIFFYAPIGILLLTNFILFLFTALRILFMRRVTSKVLNRQTNQNNTRLALYAKLFCLMGVTFVFEVISWAVQGPAYYWYVTDAINSLRGVFVFFIFCWKRSVLDLLLERAPDPLRSRIIRLFRLRDPRRFPSFSSSCMQHHYSTGANRTRSSTVSAPQQTSSTSRGSSFQLSQFGSSNSMARKANSRQKF